MDNNQNNQRLNPNNEALLLQRVRLYRMVRLVMLLPALAVAALVSVISIVWAVVDRQSLISTVFTALFWLVLLFVPVLLIWLVVRLIIRASWGKEYYVSFKQALKTGFAVRADNQSQTQPVAQAPTMVRSQALSLQSQAGFAQLPAFRRYKKFVARIVATTMIVVVLSITAWLIYYFANGKVTDPIVVFVIFATLMIAALASGIIFLSRLGRRLQGVISSGVIEQQQQTYTVGTDKAHIAFLALNADHMVVVDKQTTQIPYSDIQAVYYAIGKGLATDNKYVVVRRSDPTPYGFIMGNRADFAEQKQNATNTVFALLALHMILGASWGGASAAGVASQQMQKRQIENQAFIDQLQAKGATIQRAEF